MRDMTNDFALAELASPRIEIKCCYAQAVRDVGHPVTLSGG